MRSFWSLLIVLCCVTAGVRAQAADPVPFVPGSWTMVVLPDTQNYVANATNYPILTGMMNWIVAQKEARNIRMVGTSGDITNNNVDVQWSRAQQAFDVLNGHVPYALTLGNHDYGSNGSTNVRTTLANNYFSYDRNIANNFLRGGTLRGYYEWGHVENEFHTFTANGQKYMLMSLEWSPRDPVVKWADRVISNYPDHRVLITTHAYLYYDNTRYNWAAKGSSQSWSPYAYGTASDPGGVNDGEELWQNLAKKHANIFAVSNGHVLNDQVGYLLSQGDAGNNVHQMLFNAQNDPMGGNGWLRMLEFRPDDMTLQVKTYSPYLNQWRTTSDYQFTLQLSRVSGSGLLMVPEPALVGAVGAGMVMMAVPRRRRRM